jgi:drug/metabolite transporter (DMT)-like permease
MTRASGYADGLISGATWGFVAVLLTRPSSLMSDHPALATAVVMAAVFDSAAALFLLVRSTAVGALPEILGLVASRRALPVVACSLLGGPIFMGGYVAAVILAGPSYALTATATYPVFGAIFAQYRLHQRLGRVAWVGVVATALGAALTAFDASASADGPRTLVGVVIALSAAAGLALEGIVATYAMANFGADTTMAVRELYSAMMFVVAVSLVPAGVSTTLTVAQTHEVSLPIIVAGFIGGYSFAIWYRSIRKIGAAKAMALNITYAMWGVLFAAALHHATPNTLAIAGAAIVTIGATTTIMADRQLAGGHSW